MSEGVEEERRKPRIGTVSGLALLVGGTAVAAVAGGGHTVFATILLGLLTLGLGHALVVEIRRQAHRRGRWGRNDTINAVMLGAYAEVAMITTIIGARHASVRAVGLALFLAYAGSCGFYVTERRRSLAAQAAPPASRPVPTDAPSGAPAEQRPNPEICDQARRPAAEHLDHPEGPEPNAGTSATGLTKRR